MSILDRIFKQRQKPIVSTPQEDKTTSQPRQEGNITLPVPNVQIVFVCSTFLPHNQLAQSFVEEYQRESKNRLYAKQRAKRGLDVPEVKSFIGRSYEVALQQLLRDLQKAVPTEGFRVRTFQGERVPAAGDPGIEGFIRTLQIQQGVGFLGCTASNSRIVVGEGENRAEWDFLLLFMY